VKPTPQAASVRPAPLAIMRDIFIAPGRAYSALAANPGWLLVYIVVFALGAASVALTLPAVVHLNLRLATAGSGGAAVVGLAAETQRLAGELLGYDAIVPVLAWGIAAIVFSFACRFGGQPVPFRTLFAIAAYGSLPSALGGLIESIVIRLHDPTSFASYHAFFAAFPLDLAIFAPPGSPPRSESFLSSFGVFDLWSALVTAYGLIAVAKVGIVAALVAAFAVDLVVTLAFNA